MQSLDVQIQNPVNESAQFLQAQGKTGLKNNLNVKTGAETARNGSSFLAMIQKMIAGTMDGNENALKAFFAQSAEGKAGDSTNVPGDGNALKKFGSGKGNKLTSSEKNGIALAMNEKKGHAPLKKENGLNAGIPKNRISGEASKPEELLVDEKKVSKENTVDLKKAEPEKSVKNGTNHLVFADVSVPLEKNGANVTNKTDVDNEDGNGKKIERSDRKDKKTFISVRDERHQGSAVPGSESPLSKTVTHNNDGSADMTIGFRDAGTSVKVDTESRFMEKGDGKQGQTFASMLSSELRSNASDLVKTGSIVLRDNNSGLIRLTLHPESLGNVKISLELSSDKRITGKIIVSSKEAYDAFNENLDGLSDAFVKGGFESGGFDLSWSGQNGSGDAGADGQGKISSPFYASSIPEVMLSQDSADIQTSGFRSNGSAVVNLFA